MRTVRQTFAQQAGGPRASRLLLVLAALTLAFRPAPAAAGEGAKPPVRVVRAADGVIQVDAHFLVPQAPEDVFAVLTDYDGIPRFLPDIRRSVVRTRDGRRTVVEQEAVSGVLMFSKTVHLLLEVDETAGALVFRDTCGRSFVVYRGAWRVARSGDATLVGYQLRAKPAFAVPEFLLVRLFRRDSRETIERITREIERRVKQAAYATR